MGLNKLKQTALKHSLKGLYAYLEAMEKGLNGDMVLVLSPATLGSSAAAVNTAIGGAATMFTRTVTVSLKTAEDEICTFLNGTFAAAVANTGTGVIAIADAATVVTLVDGVGTIVIEYTGTWASTDTATLTITGSTKLGYAVADKTSVDTLIV